MNRDRWKAVNAIFQAALELPASERSGFVHSASDGDQELRSEVDRLLQADDLAASYLESPLLPTKLFQDIESSPPPFQPGEVLKNRFQILRMVGEGGMGHVFEAFDNELKVRVALKSIRPEIARNPTALELFRREVRLARTITHPNVCRTFDLDRGFLSRTPDSGREFFFLTMEFLEGETLSARLKRAGPFAPDDALDIARQVASALDAAHTADIVHRDIKPANIMLVDSPQSRDSQTRAVVTDFGLARQNPLQTPAILASISHAGAIGTLAYMAPEQLESDRPVSAATDIYAFGLVLYEMVTGLRAFPSANLLSGIAQRLAGPPPSPRAIAPDLPEVWELVIQGCLRITQDERFQSAGQVVEALGGTATTVPLSSSLPVLPALPARSSLAPRRRFQLAAIILLAVVALSAVGFRLYRSRADSKVSPGALVYLTAVKNETGERSLDNLTELLQASLGQSAQINLLDQSRVGDTLQLMTKSPETVIDEPTAREIALRTGAVRVIFATVSGSSGNYSLNVDIQQPDGTGPSLFREHWTQSFTWKSSGSTVSSAAIPPELLRAVRNSSDWIRNKVGESGNDIAKLDSPPEDITTGNWQALGEYVSAENLQSKQRTTDAITALQSAIALDPHFSRALGRLGDLLFSTGRYQEGLRAYSQALEPQEGRRLTRRERDRILGEFSIDSHDYPEAEKAYRDITLYYEADYDGWSYRGYPLLMMERTDEAIATLTRAYSLDPAKANAPFELGRAKLSIGAFTEAMRWADVLDQQGASGLANYIRGSAQFLQHDYSGATRSFSGMQQSQAISLHSWSYLLLARVASEQGDDTGARRDLQNGIVFDRQNGLRAMEANKLFALAYIEGRTGDFAHCIADVQSSLTIEASAQNIMVASAVLGLAHTDAPEPYASLLRKRILGLKQLFPPESFGTISELARLRVRGEILLASGDAKGALAVFRKASDLDASAYGREYLARALDLMAQEKSESKNAMDLRRSAMNAYAATALRPNLLWFDSVDALPGYYAGQLISYLRLAKDTPMSTDQVTFAVQGLKDLRRTANHPPLETRINPNSN